MIEVLCEYDDYYDLDQFVIFSTNQTNTTVISMILNMEISQPGTLEMAITSDNLFNKMDWKKSKVIRIFNNKTEIWRGYPVKIETDYYGNKNILCDGCLSVLKDIIVESYPDLMKDPENDPTINYVVYKDRDVIEYSIRNAVVDYAYFTLKNPVSITYFADEDWPVHRDYFMDKWDITTFKREMEHPYITLDEIINKHLLERYGGYLIYDFKEKSPPVTIEPDPSAPVPPVVLEPEGNYFIMGNGDSTKYDDYEYKENVWRIAYLSSSYKGRFYSTLYNFQNAVRTGKVKLLEKGKNIIGFKKKVDVTDIYTGVLPIGKEDLLLPEKVIVDKEAEKFFGKKLIIRQFESDQEGTLRSSARNFLDNNLYKNINLEISYFDENILSDDKNFSIPGDPVCYKYGEESSDKYIYNIICHSIQINFLEPSKSVWKTSIDDENISYNKISDKKEVPDFFHQNSCDYKVRYNSNKDEEIT